MLENKLKITFRQKNSIKCPICREVFYREELLSGRGRLIAGDLTDELRRLYKKSQKYGLINPLIYPIWVCPSCLFASMADDFFIPTKGVKEAIQANTSSREILITKIFDKTLNFSSNRKLEHGIASYILAVICYSFFEKKYAPSFKRAICSIRAAWTLQDLINENKSLKLAFIRDSFYKKAGYFYRRAEHNFNKGEEIMDTIKNYGPDVDKNYGYSGLLYMSSVLTFKQIEGESSIEKKSEILVKAKRTISHLVGSGKASYDKPSIIIDYARIVFKKIQERIKLIEEKFNQTI